MNTHAIVETIKDPSQLLQENLEELLDSLNNEGRNRTSQPVFDELHEKLTNLVSQTDVDISQEEMQTFLTHLTRDISTQADEEEKYEVVERSIRTISQKYNLTILQQSKLEDIVYSHLTQSGFL